MDDIVAEYKDIEEKLGRKIPESLMRSIWEETCNEAKDEKLGTTSVREDDTNASKRLNSKMMFLKQEMAHLRAIDIRLMQQLLTINEGIESMRWVMEEKGGLASRGSSLAGSLGSLLESPDASCRGSGCSSPQAGGDDDASDGLSVGSYLDALADESSSCVPQTDAGDLLRPSDDVLHKADLSTYYRFR